MALLVALHLKQQNVRAAFCAHALFVVLMVKPTATATAMLCHPSTDAIRGRARVLSFMRCAFRVDSDLDVKIAHIIQFETNVCTNMDFSDAEAVRELAAAGERLVCLQFPQGLGSLYCHSCSLSISSPVLRHVLEDTQRDDQAKLCTIPLAGDSDVDVWKLALGLIYRLKDATITLENAQGLLLLAHKYDMASIISRCHPPPATSAQDTHAPRCIVVLVSSHGSPRTSEL